MASPERARGRTAKQQALVEAALHVIATRGIAALTTRALAAQVGVTDGAIFRHYPTLDALLLAVVEHVEEVLEASYPACEGLEGLARLDRFMEVRSEAVGQRVGILRLVISEQFLLALPQEAAARLGGCVEKTRAFLVESLGQAQRAGELREGLDLNAAALIIMGTMQMAAVSRACLGHAGPDPSLARATLLRLLQKQG